MSPLRPFQTDAVAATIAALPRRPILVAPTGAGKTRMAVEIIRLVGRRTLWLAHARELIEQAADNLGQLDQMVGIIKAGVRETPLARVQVASVQTLVRRHKPPADLIVVDEAHHASAATYRAILAVYPKAEVLGLTATPFRLDGRGLGDLFGEIVVAARTQELVDAGYLVLPKVFASRTPDLRGVKVVAGDYSNAPLAERMNTTAMNQAIVEAWQRFAAGKRTVVFAVNVEHSYDIMTAFTAAGIAAEHLDGQTPADTRAAVLRRLRSGQTQVVCNCMLLGEGVDVPALECAILARPTASLCLHLQQMGRIMRSASGKTGAIALDFAGNHHVHGLVTRKLEYSLDGSKRVGESEPLGLRRCGECGLLYEPASLACPECGAVPVARPRHTGAAKRPEEMVEFDDGNFEYRREVWNLIESEREAMGYADGWGWYRYRERFGVEPVTADIDGRTELIDTLNATDDQKAAVYARLMRVAAERGFASGWASHRYREAFGASPRGFVSRTRVEMFREKLAALR